MSAAAVRAEAARVVAAVLRGKALDDALAQQAAQRHAPISAANQSLMRAMAYGVLRERRMLEALVGRLLDKPLTREPELQALLMCGIHQLRAMRMPAFAAVDETVKAVAILDKGWARALVNAVLRRFQRERATLEKDLPTDPALRHSYPHWLVDQLQQDWPQKWLALLAAGNEQAPMVLRVNRRRMPRDAYLRELQAAGMTGEPVAELDDALVLHEAQPVECLPGFAAGVVSVQDGAAQRAAGLLGVQDGMRVLDACAAPGGKTAQLLERAELDLTALDVDPSRLQRVGETLRRLGLDAELICADARAPAAWWNGVPYDRILVDAPCTGTGVIRRHPDIKWLRRAADVTALARLQADLLQALWPLLRPGGLLLFCTCSLLKAEGPQPIAEFLRRTPSAREQALPDDWGEPVQHGRRLAPGGAFDGFYYCLLSRPAGSA